MMVKDDESRYEHAIEEIRRRDPDHAEEILLASEEVDRSLLEQMKLRTPMERLRAAARCGNTLSRFTRPGRGPSA